MEVVPGRFDIAEGWNLIPNGIYFLRGGGISVVGLKTRSDSNGQAREDLPQGLFDVLDPLLRVLKLDFHRCLCVFLIFGG